MCGCVFVRGCCCCCCRVCGCLFVSGWCCVVVGGLCVVLGRFGSVRVVVGVCMCECVCVMSVVCVIRWSVVFMCVVG